ncbi:MAG: hypothetical protein ABSD13_13165 [Candidatus Korobacteraceae bacterium]|jgi:hypothetical protein
MISRITVFVVLVLSLAAYAASPAGHTTASPNATVVCCDGDPAGFNP